MKRTKQSVQLPTLAKTYNHKQLLKKVFGLKPKYLLFYLNYLELNKFIAGIAKGYLHLKFQLFQDDWQQQISCSWKTLHSCIPDNWESFWDLWWRLNWSRRWRLVILYDFYGFLPEILYQMGLFHNFIFTANWDKVQKFIQNGSILIKSIYQY